MRKKPIQAIHCYLIPILTYGKQLNQTTNVADLLMKPHLPQKKTDPNIFISPNRFSPIAPTIEDDPMDNITEQTSEKINQTSKPPPIFIQAQLNFNTSALK